MDIENIDKTKSSAQVARMVRPQVVSHDAGGLKPNRKRPFRLMARFSEDEHLIVLQKATASQLSVNEFIRVSVLGQTYMSPIDPELRKLLVIANRELSRQGNNLNQIAKHMNGGRYAPEQGDSMLLIIGRSLLSAHKLVRQALADGQTAP